MQVGNSYCDLRNFDSVNERLNSLFPENQEELYNDYDTNDSLRYIYMMKWKLIFR